MAFAKSVRDHRKKQATFFEIAEKLRKAAVRCAKLNSRSGDSEFWASFWGLWGDHSSRFQGSGIQYKGKSAKWHQACAALVRILVAGSNSLALDSIVSREIDDLAEQKNPMRGAWLSEMLCHYFPERYPIKNQPVKKWLAKNKLRGRKGATEGQRYVELAQQLRLAVRTRPAGARNLAELDGAIWRWAAQRTAQGA